MWLAKFPTSLFLHDLSMWHQFMPNNNLKDRSYEAHDITGVTGAALGTVNMHDGYSYSFDGTGDFLQIGAVTNALNLFDTLGASGFTIEAWINPDNEGQNGAGRILDKSDNTATATGDGYVMGLNAGTGSVVKLFGVVKLATTNAVAVTTDDAAGTVTQDAWHHVAMTYDEDGDKKIKLYGDGQLLTLATDTAGEGDPADDGGIVVRIGNTPSADTRSFDGDIGSIRVWRKPLTITQIGQIYDRFK